MDINKAIVAQAEINVPKSGFDTSSLFTLPTNEAGDQVATPIRADNTSLTADNSNTTADAGVASPKSKVQGYLTGDGTAPNSVVTGAGVAFPESPSQGDYFLRLDYLPNRLFRFSGYNWSKVEDAVRTNLTPGADNKTQKSGFVNNTNTYKDAAGNTHTERQSLSKVLTPKADN